MTVDITQDEMNILNLNGISAEDVRANVEFSRATGMDDDAIRQQFSSTIERLKPLTKVSANDTGKIKEWQDKGAITPFELGQRRGVVFNGNYDNIDNSANLSAIGQKLENSAYNNVVEQRIQAAKNQKAERNKRVNEGTASFFDRAGAALDRMGQASYQAQLNAPEDITLKMAGVNKPKDKSGEIDFNEALGNSFMSGSWLPFVGGYIGSADTKKEREIEERIRNGKPIRQDELNFINHRIEQRQEESVRGYTYGGQIANSFLPSLFRIGGEIATGQWMLRGLGLAAELPAGATLGQKVMHGLGEMGKTGALSLTPFTWDNAFEDFQERMLKNEFDITDKGQIIFQESAEKPATAFMKSLGKTFVMFASEASGGLLGLPIKGLGAAATKYAGTPIGNYLKSNKVLSEFAKKVTPELSKLYEKMNKLPIKGESVDWLKSQVKFDGFIEELGEEVLEDVLNLTIGTENEERSLENYAKAIFKSPDEWAILAGAVALQGGTLSVASHLLGKHLEENGAEDEQIVEILNNLSETEKEELVDNIIEEGLLNIEETEEQHFEKTVSSVAESLMQSGRFKNRENADKAVRLGATMLESMSKKTGKSLDELIQEDMAEIEEIDESVYTDENNRLYAAIENSPMSIGDKVNALFDEFDALGEEYDDIEDINNRIEEIRVLEDISNGETLSIEDVEFANDLIAKYEESGDIEFANTVRNALNNENKEVHFQRANLAGAEREELIDAAKEWKEKGTESKYFKNWFGDSKVVDENGQPLVVYHGTEENFDTFDRDKLGSKSMDIMSYLGFHFTPNKEMAERLFVRADADIMPVYLNIQNPYITKESELVKEALLYAKANNKISSKVNLDKILKMPYFSQDGKSIINVLSDDASRIYYDETPLIDYKDITMDYLNHLKGQGYDGIKYINEIEWADENRFDYIAFEPEQIKSVSNRGTFDTENPNIYFHKKGQGLKDTFKNAIINIVKKMESADENIFTVSEMLPHIPMFDSIQDFFADIQDVKIELVSDSEYKNGRYIPELDSVKINKDSLKIANMPIGRIETLLHELQHAKQKRIYDKYQALLENKSQLSAAEISEYETYCTNYENTGKANREKDEFDRKHKRELDKIKRIFTQKGMKGLELEFLRDENLFQVYKQKRKYYNDYVNSFGEVDARETAKQLIYRMGYGDIYENQNKQFARLQLHRRTESTRGRGLHSGRGPRDNGALRITRTRGLDSEFSGYFQSDKNPQETGNESGASNRGSETSAKQRRIFIDNERADVIANRFEKIKGTFIPAENLIALFKDSDESTIIHEFAHWWLEKLVKYAAENEELQDDLAEIRKFLKNDGEPFTSDQHERFARGFEAYMRTGSARTNRLKKLFEDFKNALLSLYDSIKELGFDEDEIPEINNLFERLLTTENQRIQAAVFDRCNAINAQIQEIRDNQEKEFAEIEEIERNNLERNLRDNKRNQQIKEYLRLAQKAVSRIPKGIREYQERYKKATFEILEVATGYKRQFIANPKNWEIVEQKIADIADQITTQDGMQANWREFYTDTGVSYDNDEIGGDYELAQQAFKTLTSGNYSPMNMEEEEIGRFFGMFDYLEGKVMTLKGENKSAAYEALCSLFNDIPSMPDEAMQELVDKLQAVGEKFLDQKTMEKNPTLGIPNVSLSVQFRTYVTQKMHNMKAYDPESKRVIRLSQVNRLYTLLKFTNSVAETKQIIRNINNHAIEQLENRQKFILHKEIQKQVRINSKLMKVGALKRGKFDWKTNTVFSQLQELNRLSLEAAQKEYQNLINADSAVLGEERESVEQNPAASLEAPTEFQAILKTKFLEYKANRVRDLNLAATRSLLEDIIELKFEGRRAKNAEELKKALSRYDYETDLVRIAYLNKNDKFANYLTKWTAGDTIFTSEGTLANWESLLNHIFDKHTAQKYSLLKTESDVEVYAHKKCLEFYNKALDIYGLRNKDFSTKGKLKDLYGRALDFDNTQPIIKLFQEYENEGHTYKFNQFTYNKDTNQFVETSIDLTHSQLITLYAWSLNPELKKRIIVQFIGEPEDNDYTEFEETLNNLMFSKLSNQDKEFAQAMIDTCDSMYNDTNEVFIRTTGLSLPRVENYIPSKTERIGSDLDMLHENVLRSTNPSFIKQRKTCRRIKMEPVSPLEIILPHINKTARYIVMSEKVNFYNRIFQSPDVKAAILDIYGKKTGTKIYRVLLNQLATSTYENYARAITVGKNMMDTIASNYITSRIGGNIKVFLSQLTSVINYSENMPAMEWAKGFKDALAHPKETVEFMFNNCPYLQARLAGNSQNEIIATITNEADKMRSLRNFCTANTKFGDIIAIMFGGKPYVDYLMKNVGIKDEKTGEFRLLTQEEAFERFVESTLRSQQSGHNSATSAWQKQSAQNALARMVFAFNNTNFQYERKFVDALSNYHRKHISKKEFAKAFLVYKVFNPILFSSFLTNLSVMTLIQNLFGGGDDDPFKTFGADALVSIALSNWKAYGMLGILANSLVAAVAATATDGKFFESGLPLITDFEKSLQKLLRGKNLDTGDYIEILAGVGDYTTGVATTRIYNSLGGVGDIAQGEFGKGFLRIIGYGNYRASVAATGQEPDKRK